MEIRDEFDKRVSEINSFYEILEIIKFEKAKISAFNIDEDKIEDLVIDNSKIDTLRSTSYLLLYNLIESTIYNSITTIFDSIKDKGLKYFDIIEEVQKYWLNNLYKHDDKKRKETIIDTIMNIATQIFNNTIVLSSNEINYGGSLDAQTIFSTAKSVKMQVGNIRKIYDENTHGQTLLEIKRKRNWLAHGEKSFIEVGSSSTFSQLNNAKIYVIEFLSEYISSVESYLQNQEYKKATV
ncbi:MULTISPECIES: MAE_28990/MAE_18760 family HEPN-like nuclease [Chryseobacterium]|uniref:MAE-28990/MAE-18760-like HEPN domain-containing protein n=1 Tax=Chryseobacterium taihuense TaxID=1141221 RepID=A0A1G9Q8F8_9FLAO|nr:MULTISPECIES: MAE_28990/MAE_18760 family HEPN-like nuclease [Chryseobacterium]QQV02593.1 hypothetical protein I6I61_16250 [Chryseobacterium sp. FDAARGOS 1104]SDM07344.1 hypothetical protein SAMN05216273_11242 [Chryseobacterium taihuense]VFB04152.1 Uncharacterised protein [Chryseobacterium taihuense]